MVATISEYVWGHLSDGHPVKKFVLTNARGTKAVLTNFGAAWLGFYLPNHTKSVVAGCATVDQFVSQRAYLGATIGRYANRIGFSRFMLADQLIELTKNLPPHHLHGGTEGFSHKLWDSHITLSDSNIPTLTLSYVSPDGEEGYPGEVKATVTVTLSEDNRIRFEYRAETNKPTVANFTNHAYFNLGLEQQDSLAQHEVMIPALYYLAADETALPTGELVSVANTALDLRHPTNIYSQLTPLHDPELIRANGYDHCYVFENNAQLKLMAQAQHGTTGVSLSCYSTLPGMQFYTGNFMGGTPKNELECYKMHEAFCFEPGYWPDSPNQSHFPDCTITPEKPYTAIIEYQITEEGEQHA